MNYPSRVVQPMGGLVATRGNKVYLIANSKGGPGKTTTSINLLTAIAMELFERKLHKYGIKGEKGEKAKKIVQLLRTEKGMNVKVLTAIIFELLLTRGIDASAIQQLLSLPQMTDLILTPILQEDDIDETFGEQLHTLGIEDQVIEVLFTAIPDLRDLVQNDTLLCEMDPQEDASHGIGINLEDGAKSMHDVLSNRFAGIEYAVHRTPFGVDILPASVLMSELETSLVSNQVMRREFLLYDALYQARGTTPDEEIVQAVDRYKVIFIDPPPSLGQLSFNATVPADGIIAILDMGVYAYDAIDRLKARIELIRQANPALDIAGVLCNRFDARQGFVLVANIIEDQARQEYGGKVFKTKIPYNASILNAPLYGLPVQYYEPGLSSTKSATQAYAGLAKEFIERFGIQ